MVGGGETQHLGLGDGGDEAVASVVDAFFDNFVLERPWAPRDGHVGPGNVLGVSHCTIHVLEKGGNDSIEREASASKLEYD